MIHDKPLEDLTREELIDEIKVLEENNKGYLEMIHELHTELTKAKAEVISLKGIINQLNEEAFLGDTW